MSDSLIPPTILRNLSDKLYDRRKVAAQDIENLVKELCAGSDMNKRIFDVIEILTKELAYSTNPNARKGGLIGLAAVSIALGPNIGVFLSKLIEPVLECFTDQDSRVRYYACESLYNIAKVSRDYILQHFNALFEGLSKLSADADSNVKKGTQLLDRLIKDVVTESDKFDVNDFMPLLKERIYVINPYVRQFIVSWVSVLDSVPDIDMLSHLSEFLDGMYIMLSDQHAEIRGQAQSVLGEFLKGIKEHPETVSFDTMIEILLPHCTSKDDSTALTALMWTNEFVLLAKDGLIQFTSKILDSILPSLAHVAESIRSASSTTNRNLLKCIHESPSKFDIESVLRSVTLQLANASVPPRLSALRWILMLLLKMKDDVFKLMDELFPALLKTLSDESDDVVRLDLEVLARISENSVYFDLFTTNLMKLFCTDRKLLENRGSLIIRQLSLHLDPEAIYRALAATLENEEDYEFSWIMVQSLNIILFTSPELAQLRSSLKNLTAESGRSLFTALYKSWCHNPVAVFALCLLSQAYEHASDIVDKLVQLIESPVFTHLRLQLIEPSNNPFLFKALYGLLMILPQSSAFDALHRRLSTVSTLALLHLVPGIDMKSKINDLVGEEKKEKEKEKEKEKGKEDILDFAVLLGQFIEIQEKREAARRTLFHDREVSETLSKIAQSAHSK